MGCKADISKEEVAGEIFKFLQSKAVINDEWPNNCDWLKMKFKHIATPSCYTMAQLVGCYPFCPKAALGMFRAFMSPGFRSAKNIIFEVRPIMSQQRPSEYV